MKTFQVIEIGRKVKIMTDIGDNQEGFISAIEIRNISISYEVIYWNAGERKSVWINDWEIKSEINGN